MRSAAHNRISPRSGYTLKVCDCYRPQRAVDEFVGWADDLGDDSMKAEFIHESTSRRCSPTAISPSSRATVGSTVDLTLVKVPAASTASYIPGDHWSIAPHQEDRFRGQFN